MALRKHTRIAVFERDGYCCRYCGAGWTDEKTGEPIASYFDDAPVWCGGPRWVGLLHVDHVLPRCKGGTDELDNLVTACRDCNLEKYDKVWTPIPLESVA